MNILYTHGFGSKFDANGDKVKELSIIGTVMGVDVDYAMGSQNVSDKAKEVIQHKHIDLIVGCSMGGWLAAKMGCLFGIPFVALNPCIKPSVILASVPSDGIYYTGEKYVLTPSVIASYDDIAVKNGCGLVLLDDGDEFLDSNETAEYLENIYKVIRFSGGTHRFSHMKESLKLITNFMDRFNADHGLVGE